MYGLKLLKFTVASKGKGIYLTTLHNHMIKPAFMIDIFYSPGKRFLIRKQFAYSIQ